MSKQSRSPKRKNSSVALLDGPETLDQDFLASFLELDPEVTTALLQLQPSNYGNAYTYPEVWDTPVSRPIADDYDDDDILGLTAFYAEPAAVQPAVVAPTPRARRTATTKQVNRAAVVVELVSVEAPTKARKASAKPARASRSRKKAPARRAPAPEAQPRERAAAFEELVSDVQPQARVAAFEELVSDAQPQAQVAAFEALVPEIVAPEVAAAALTRNVPAIRPPVYLPPSTDLAPSWLAAAQSAGWLIPKPRGAMQWDYMNFEMAPAPVYKTVRAARRAETRNMIKYYRINPYKSHAREDRKETRRLLAQARRGRLATT